MFRWNVVIPANKLQVKVEHGWVTLSGETEWHYQSDEAVKVAAKVSGVTGVSNAITIRNGPRASDVRKRIEEAFRRQANLDAATVTVTTRGGKVTLGWQNARLS